MGEGGNVRKYKLTPTRARTPKHKHKIKEEEAEPGGGLELFPNQRHEGQQETFSSYSGNSEWASDECKHTHTRIDARTPLQIHSSSEEPI